MTQEEKENNQIWKPVKGYEGEGYYEISEPQLLEILYQTFMENKVYKEHWSDFGLTTKQYPDQLIEELFARLKAWHTSELNRKMQEVVRVYADKIKADINNGVEYNKKNYNRDEITKEQIFAYLDHWLHDLKALLNVVNADD